MVRKITHELTFVYITGDGKKFLDEDDAKLHQVMLEVLDRERRENQHRRKNR